jgi:pimeloyl-ACP methyl ester carboxylesterase
MTQSYHLLGMALTNRTFTVPLDHAEPQGNTLTVFAREVRAREREGEDLPYLVFFQGGPGSSSPRPETRSGWLKRTLEEYRVLLLDQRGTGLSSPVSFQTLSSLDSPEAQARYLSYFRADAIVADAEAIRKELIGDEPWSVLGQSFGGFCALRYLSSAPEGLREVFITGGIPSLTRPADDVYRATYPRVEAKNRQFFDRYPWAQAICERVAAHLSRNEVRLPNGQRFTVEQFQQLGIAFGASGGFERVMELLEQAFVTVDGEEQLSYIFLHGMLDAVSFHTQPIYTVLHEAIYCQENASNWAAERVRSEFPQFDYAPGKPFLFTGEMVYPWMLEQYNALQPLQQAAQLLAEKPDWPKLYDLNVLARNTVPVAAVLYYHDMYVDLGYAVESVQKIPNVKTWITSEYEHNGLRADGETILEKLINLLRS